MLIECGIREATRHSFTLRVPSSFYLSSFYSFVYIPSVRWLKHVYLCFALSSCTAVHLCISTSSLHLLWIIQLNGKKSSIFQKNFQFLQRTNESTSKRKVTVEQKQRHKFNVIAADKLGPSHCYSFHFHVHFANLTSLHNNYPRFA